MQRVDVKPSDSEDISWRAVVGSSSAPTGDPASRGDVDGDVAFGLNEGRD
jgi:hypothetical protein